MKCKFIIILISITFVSCRKFLDVGSPPSKVIASDVFKSNASSAAVLTGIYSDMVAPGNFTQGANGLSIGCGLAADELKVYPTASNYGFLLLYGNNGGDIYWGNLYGFIYRINTALEGLLKSESLLPSVKKQLLGEAYFLRAFCYFYLINLYGPVPLLIKSDYRININASKSNLDIIYNQIIDDLLIAQNNLSDEYVDSDAKTITQERIRPNSSLATAFLARVNLFTGNWLEAINHANKVIEKKELYDTVPLKGVFLANSREAIWQLQTNYSVDVVPNFYNTLDGKIFILKQPPDATNFPIWLSERLISVFENNDKRKVEWIGVDSSSGIRYYYPYKYKVSELDIPQKEYLMVFRLAELYLIRAEAEAELNNLTEAIENINVLRIRARLNRSKAITEEEVKVEILKERQRELFTEWGHRWLDIKRLDLADNIMSGISIDKGSNWAHFKILFPIPRTDLLLNPNLKQNDGYISP